MTTPRGGSGNFAMDPERAREAGKKGGQLSGGKFRNKPEGAGETGGKGGKKNRRVVGKTPE
ncbi:stress-induced protein [Pantoea sp. RIT-PI-b]|uniref:general stress protein n=1 Tax=Pantoea sp. RIT-PI-b TaxID=1681195 RepID=UPI0006760EE1|nr:general stress protein [Pantoea sp. RIT-PI-b]KNC17590.1 stress-induced protein [Pantoea sp. RIT-PI-b]